MIEKSSTLIKENAHKLLNAFDISRHVDPVVTYINEDRSKKRELLTDTVVDIPISRTESVPYTKKSEDWTTDRGMHAYNARVFGDEFTYYIDNQNGLTSEKSSTLQPILGGQAEAFAAGKKVLELGSGEAVALLQFSRLYPRTSFVGVDFGYQPSMKLDLRRVKPQLIHQNWDTLSSFPDACIDTFISIQGGMTWGTYKDADRAIPMLEAITRIAKPGAILRSDEITQHGTDSYEVDYMKKLGWSVRIESRCVVCVKS